MTRTATNNVIPAEPARKEPPGPGRQLYRMVLGGLVARGERFSTWCRASGLDVSRTRAALYGLSDTEEARELRARAMVAAGLIEEKS